MIGHVQNPSMPEDQPNPRVKGWEPVVYVPDNVTLPRGSDAWRKGTVRAVRSHERGRWRLNLSHGSRWPSWTEVRDAIRAMIPDGVWMAVVFAPDGHPIHQHGGTVTVVQVPDLGLGVDVKVSPPAKV